jgi:hypothetical protein
VCRLNSRVVIRARHLPCLLGLSCTCEYSPAEHCILALLRGRRLENVEKCEATEEFEHGEFKITKDGALGTLFEVTGKAERTPVTDGESSPLVKTADAMGAAVHVAVRGMPVEHVHELVEMVRTASASGRVAN